RRLRRPNDVAKSHTIEILIRAPAAPREFRTPKPHRKRLCHAARFFRRRVALSRPLSEGELSSRSPTALGEQESRLAGAGTKHRLRSARYLAALQSPRRLNQASTPTPTGSAIKTTPPTNPTSIPESAAIRPSAPVPHSETINEPITSVPGPKR